MNCSVSSKGFSEMLGGEECKHDYVKQPYTSAPRTPKETYEVYVCSLCKDVRLERLFDLTYLDESDLDDVDPI